MANLRECCVWTRLADIGDPFETQRVQFQAGCNRLIARGVEPIYPDFCPGCSKPVKIKPRDEAPLTSNLHTCPDCRNQFVQPFVCTTCGAQKLYDETVRSQSETIDKLVAAVNRLCPHRGDMPAGMYETPCPKCLSGDSSVVETSARQLSATERLHNICDALSEQADESPFTREEWEAVDRQTARLNSALKNLIDAVRNVEIEKRPWDLFMALPLQNAYRALKHQDALTEIVGPDGSPVETSAPQLTDAQNEAMDRDIMQAIKRDDAQKTKPEPAKCTDCGVEYVPGARHFSGCKSHPGEPAQKASEYRSYPGEPIAGIYEAGIGIVRLGDDDELGLGGD